MRTTPKDEEYLKKILKKRAEAQKKLERAEGDYKKTISEMAPFIPKPKTQEITTEGKWQTTSSIIVNYGNPEPIFGVYRSRCRD